MKHIVKFICLLLVLILAVPALPVSAGLDEAPKAELRGLWVATVVNIDYPSKATTDPEVLKGEAVEILDRAADMGLNAIFLQVRPTADAMYKSKLFPWSKYLTGSQGLAPDNGFDPLEFWITEAHKRGIELHAWINPYRITKKTSKEAKHDFASLSPSNPARLRSDLVVKHTDGNLYFNPGIPEVRQLVIDGVLEIVDNYDVDGIHFDDYFYPGKDFNDKAAFAKYGAGYGNIDDWRRANVNALISDLSKALKQHPKKVRFGISPFGIWANKSANPLGSDTNGMQSYYDQYADTRKWVKDGLLDYIAPQLYWNIGYKAADYSKLLSWWSDTVSGTGVDLYIGQAAYRCGGTDPASPWYGVSELERQLQLNEKYPQVAGSIFFSNNSFSNNPALITAVRDIYRKKDENMAVTPVIVSRPSGDIYTAYDRFYLNGASDPGRPLYLNGKLVENRSSEGYFGILVPLEPGVNIFTFSQAGSGVTRTIYRDTASSDTEKLVKPEIILSSVFPQEQEYRSPGEKVDFTCKAPEGSRVFVTIGKKTYEMTYSGGMTYTYSYTIPEYSGSPRIIDLGAPVYTMSYNGIVSSSTAPARVGVIMKGAPYIATVSKQYINVYNTSSSSNGAVNELYEGMEDYVTGMTGSFVRLSLGKWVNKADVKLSTSDTKLYNTVKKAYYYPGGIWDGLRLVTTAPCAAIAEFDGTALKLSIAAASSAVLPRIPENSPIASVTYTKDGNTLQYTMTIKPGYRIDGYNIKKTADGLTLNIKKGIKAGTGEKPLAGITVMLDPGHGGDSAGAIGPLGLKYAEKTIALDIALKLKSELEQLGAAVVMTRTEDKGVSLEERLEASRSVKPDMFLSIHGNSMEDNVDISKVEGFSVFYRDKLSRALAEEVSGTVLSALNRVNKGIHNANYFVLRGAWAPSVLIECGFVPNPEEFEWMTGDAEQARLAKSIADAVVNYFRK